MLIILGALEAFLRVSPKLTTINEVVKNLKVRGQLQREHRAWSKGHRVNNPMAEDRRQMVHSIEYRTAEQGTAE